MYSVLLNCRETIEPLVERRRTTFDLILYTAVTRCKLENSFCNSEKIHRCTGIKLLNFLLSRFGWDAQHLKEMGKDKQLNKL